MTLACPCLLNDPDLVSDPYLLTAGHKGLGCLLLWRDDVVRWWEDRGPGGRQEDRGPGGGQEDRGEGSETGGHMPFGLVL